MENPIAIIENRRYDGLGNLNQKSLESSVIFIFERKNPLSGKPVDKATGGIPYIGAFEVSTGGRLNGDRIDAHQVNTIHSPGNLEDYVKRAADTERNGGVGVYYVNKKALARIKSGQLQELESLGLEGFIHSILDSDSPVNAKQIEQTQTRQFAHWFNGSKVVDKNGDPLVLYHGSKKTDIDEFRTKNEWGYGGLHLSRYDDVAKDYAGDDGKVYKLYEKAFGRNAMQIAGSYFGAGTVVGYRSEDRADYSEYSARAGA